MSTIWNSIRRPSLYQSMTKRPLWRTVLSLLAFFTLLTALHSFLMGHSMSPFLTFMEKEFPAKMPSFTYDGSKLHVDSATPLTLSGTDEYNVIVDVSSAYPRETINKIRSGVVIGQTDLFVIDRGMEQSFSYKQLMMPPMTKDAAVKMVPYLRPFLVIVLIVWSLVLIGWSFLQITFFSFIASLFASLRRIRLPYRELWLIAAFALVPASLIDFLNFFIGSRYLALAFWVAILTYIYHGVGSFKERDGLP